jgi:hypothetical protein
LDGIRAVSQVHCHQHAVLGWDADQQLLSDAGADAEQLDSGCCGLAGNFGFEKGHLEVSGACAEQVLLPALRDADPATVVLADGFSCRTQIHELDSGGREAVHLAELLNRARTGVPTDRSRPDLMPGDRPERPGVVARAAALTGAGAVAGAGVVAGVAAARRAVARRRP